MIKIYLILTLVLFSFFANAQDKIYLKSGDNIEAKILEVNKDDLKYKKFSNLEGPIFTIEKSDIQMVVYQNGESQIFKDNSSKESETGIVGLSRNRINVDVLAYAYNGPSYISYERLTADGKFGYEIPLSVYYYTAGQEYSGGYSGITTGLNLKFYVSGEGKGFYIGPAFSLGVFDYQIIDFGGTSIGSGLGSVLGGKTGFQFQLTKVFGLSAGGTLGYFVPFTKGVNGEISYSLNLGLNFTF